MFLQGRPRPQMMNKTFVIKDIPNIILISKRVFTAIVNSIFILIFKYFSPTKVKISAYLIEFE